MKKLAIYVRTSTDKQDTGLEAQLMSCKDYCRREDVTEFLVFSDDDESGGKERRPALDTMLKAVDDGHVDRVLVYCLSRLSRSVIQCYMLAAEFKNKGVRLLSCSETIDFDTPEGRLLYGILAVINQYQKEDIVRKVKNGLENAKRKGIKLGRPMLETNDEQIWALSKEGKTIREIAVLLDIPRTTVRRRLSKSPKV